MNRGLWFAAGAVSGVYALFKVKRTAENFTPDGLGARVAAARTGARMFAEEVASGMREREADLLAEVRASSAPRAISSRTAEEATGPSSTTRAIDEKASAHGNR